MKRHVVRAKCLLPFCVAILLAGCGGDSGQPAPAGAALSCEVQEGVAWQTAWQSDVHCVTALLEEHHPAPFAAAGRSAYDAAARDLENMLPQMDQHEAIAGFMSLVAMVKDVHTFVTPPFALQPVAPVTFEAFEDGVFVLEAPEDQAHAAGARVASINGLAVSDVLAALATLEPDESPGMRPYRTVALLSRPGLLWARDVSGDPAGYAVALADDPESLNVDIHDLGTPTVKSPDPESAELPVSFKGRESNFRVEAIATMRLLYVQHNLGFDAGGYDHQQLADDIAEILEQGEVDRVVVDLRYNPGGISALFDPVVQVLAEHVARGPVQVYAAIGPATYSAAVQNAIKLRDEANAILIGNPTVEPANHFGDVRFLSLPNSRMQFRVSSRFLELDPGNNGPLQPDIVLPRHGADFVAGVDPMLEWLKVN